MPEASSDKPKLSNARAERMGSEVRTDVPKPGDVPKAEPLGLRAMLALGEEFEVYGYSYRVAAFPLRRLPEVGNMLSAMHPVLFCYALSWDEKSKEYDLDEAADLLNRLYRAEVSEDKRMTSDQFVLDFAQVAMYITDVSAANMALYVHTALLRTHPSVTLQEVEEWLDVPNFCDFLRTTFRVNTKLRERF